ncbi:ABC transporter substrate-binding protein [Parachlamydia acanthamoebae]|uniref:ABC transporter substrate-binding protein n=1 Tax=Parachlamydia acanthamoebae TaxID=83552 RepID=UPI0002F2E669|nr:ABC transporter substrate-binding protein [Parachlamydia acanthamoebae]
MNREPIGLYIFRYILGLGMFAFMCMLYWSSVLIENNLKIVQTDIGQIRSELYNLKNESERIRDTISNLPRQSGEYSPSSSSLSLQKPIVRPHMDPKLPNLLTEDPFYTTILPKMLPKHFSPQGIFRQTSIGKPDNLHPFSPWAEISQWQSLCSISLANLEFGRYETFATGMAIKMEERIDPEDGGFEYWIHLRDDVFWEPLEQRFFSDRFTLAPHFLHKHQVTAHDFKFFFDAFMNPYNQQPSAVTSRNQFQDVQKFEVLDDFTLAIRWKTHEFKNEKGEVVKRPLYRAKLLTGSLNPLASFVYKYFPDGQKIIPDDTDPDTYQTNSVWAQNFGMHWAQNIIPSCGAWKFDGMTERMIQFTRNNNFYSPDRALMERREVEFKNTPDAEWQTFKTGDIQASFLPQGKLLELQDFLSSPLYQEQAKAGKTIHQLNYIGNMFFYIGWNQKTPFFRDKTVRQALTMAIDRNRIIQQNLNGLGVEINGPFTPNSPSYDHSIQPWPFDPDKARRLLAEAGWEDHDGDGVIDKKIDGVYVPFHFKLTYFVKNSSSKSICEYIVTALKDVGIIGVLNGVDMADLSNDFESKAFEAIHLGWGQGTPPEDMRQIWHSSGAKEKGSSNGIGFSNAEVDQIIDDLDYEYNPEKRLALYHRFSQIIHEEAPYVFLYAPMIKLLYREELQNVFLPIDRQDLIPGANVAVPDSNIYWLKKIQA